MSTDPRTLVLISDGHADSPVRVWRCDHMAVAVAHTLQSVTCSRGCELTPESS